MKNILITGGTGTIGSTLVKYLLYNSDYKITVYSRDEKKQADLANQINYNKRVNFIIGDIRDSFAVTNVVNEKDIIIHTAAMKRIEVCEQNPREAYNTNVIGTENLLNACKKNQRFIGISTDKAVFPINTYGYTKALQEKLILNYDNNNKTNAIILRYGNVLGSRGSVLEMFKKDIVEKRCLNVTDLNMSRFWLTKYNAINFIIKWAFNKKEHGCIIVKDLKSSSLEDLIIALSSINDIPMSDLDINIIGYKHSEKKHEILIRKDELQKSIQIDDDILIYPKSKNIKNINNDYTSENASHYSIEEMKKLIIEASSETKKEFSISL